MTQRGMTAQLHKTFKRQQAQEAAQTAADEPNPIEPAVVGSVRAMALRVDREHRARAAARRVAQTQETNDG